MATIIIGGGIIGLSTAYYLATLEPELAASHKIHIVDSASHLLLSASAYAGGFLAKDWFNPSVSSLGELSFRLHKELAAANDGSRNWSYMPSTAYSLAIESSGVRRKHNKGDDWLTEGTSRVDAAGALSSEGVQPTGDAVARNQMLNFDGTPAWFTKQKGGTLEVIDAEGGCAQIVPKELCEWLINACEEQGVKIHTRCTVTAIWKDEKGDVTGIKVKKDNEIYEKHCQNVVLAAGPWTPRAFAKLFPESNISIPVEPLAGYSITVRSPRYSKPILDPLKDGQSSHAGISQAVYCPPTSNWNFAPEAFSRVPQDGKPEIWAGGVNDAALPLPATADDVQRLKDLRKTEELKKAVIAMTGQSQEGDDLNFDDLEIVRESLCFRPASHNGSPIISKLPEASLGHGIRFPEGGGVYVASGHGPWGISLSLGTGLVMAEMLTGRKTSADVSRLAIEGSFIETGQTAAKDI